MHILYNHMRLCIMVDAAVAQLCPRLLKESLRRKRAWVAENESWRCS